MVYCKKFTDGTSCIINAPDGTPQEVIDYILKTERREIIKIKKIRKRNIALLAISTFCAAAVSLVFIIRGKLKKKKA